MVGRDVCLAISAVIALCFARGMIDTCADCIVFASYCR
jgi:hypothetical protein